WNVFGFENKGGSTNPFLVMFDELNWAFIVALIASFIALIFTFDAVSGEKETKTLALTLSSPFSRGTLLAGKFASAVITVLSLIVPGMILSTLIILLSGRVILTATFALEVAGFVVVTILMVGIMAAFGLLSSVLTRNSNVSLLIALSFWLVFVVAIPNSSLFIAKSISPIEHAEAVQNKVDRAFEDLDKNAPKGSWMMNGSNPFQPQHRLRADLQTKRSTVEKQIRDAYYSAMFRQFDRTRLVTIISPVSLFEYLSEAVVGGGYLRFRKAWDDMHVYQGQFLNFFLAFDAADKDSPHWYNPNEDVSTTRKPVAFEKMPQFMEKPMSFVERVASVLRYLIIGVFYACAVFLLTYVLFVRYDVR
ncbi:MAG TPA: ABC transporter permease subunit, partial [Syntrophobacteraceae bacterium]|nr:ABC transporter permease subunit [Syntrophobacteraceae bacterium]